MHARAVALFLVACALSAVAGVPFAATAGAAAPRAAQVTPSTALGDQVAVVTWQHFHPSRADGTFTVSIYQCKANPTNTLRDCNTDEPFPFSQSGNQVLGVTQKDGTGSAFIDIASTARLPSLACTATSPCSLMVFENTPNSFDPNRLPANRVLVPLHFRRSFGDCPPVTHFDLQVEAESSAAAAFYQWAADVCTGKGAFTVDVTNTSSNGARDQFFAKTIDIGVSSLPPQQSELPSDPRPYSVTPVDLTAIVFAYNIVDPVTQQQITDLTLSPRLVARLVSSSQVITLFDDPEFKQLNPKHHFPISASEPLLRAEQNADTWLVTNWLQSDKNARRFLDGHDPYRVAVNPAWRGVLYPTDAFEARNPSGAYIPRTGEESVAQKLFYATKPADSVPTNPADTGFIGIVDLATARRFNLPTAKLTRGVGKPVVAADVDSIQAGYDAMNVTAKGYHVIPGSPSDPKAYPLTKVDHALAPTDTANELTRKRIEYLLAYATKGAGKDTLPAGFVPFPTPEAPTTTTTSTTTTTTTTPPGSTDPGGGGYTATQGYGTGDGTGGVPIVVPGGGGPVTTGGTKRDVTLISAPKLPLGNQSDGVALPIVLGLGLLALVYLLGDLAVRRGPAFVAAARRRN